MISDNTEELAQNKLILLYIIEQSPFTFSKKELNEFILERNYMNYFFLQQYLSELVNSEFIEIVREDNFDKYKITENGKLVLDYFNNKIPSKLKDELKEEFNLVKSMIKTKSQVVAEYYPKENGEYIANIKLVENDNVLFSLYLNVASLEQAKLICTSWEEKTDEIYVDILNTLIKK